KALESTQEVIVPITTTFKVGVPIFFGFVFSGMAQGPSAKIVSAANSFLTTLDAKQRQSVLFSLDDEKQRVRWSNLPTTMVRRAGLNMGELSATQKSAAMALLSTVLSKRGYEKVQQIMDGDELLKVDERSKTMFGRDLFYISIMGTPSEKVPWML